MLVVWWVFGRFLILNVQERKISEVYELVIYRKLRYGMTNQSYKDSERVSASVNHWVGIIAGAKWVLSVLLRPNLALELQSYILHRRNSSILMECWRLMM